MRSSPDRAWAAVTRPRLLGRWLTRDAKVDLRVGGAYRDGNGDRGSYLEITRNRRLRFTWDNAKHCPGTVVTFDFESHRGGGTRVHLRHAGLGTSRDVAHMRGGWTEALDLLKTLLESRPGRGAR